MMSYCRRCDADVCDRCHRVIADVADGSEWRLFTTSYDFVACRICATEVTGIIAHWMGTEPPEDQGDDMMGWLEFGLKLGEALPLATKSVYYDDDGHPIDKEEYDAAIRRKVAAEIAARKMLGLPPF